MNQGFKKAAFGVVLFTTTVLLCELALQVAAFSLAKSGIVPSRPVALQVEDSVLGVRGNPSYPGHDARGFRNPAVPERVSVVALGDSQTYGVGVLPEEAWSMQLARRADITTYSMALGSYGPTHSLLLLEEALAFRPALVVEAFYSGNDLYESYVHVHKAGQLRELGTTRANLLERIAKAEKNRPIDEKVGSLFQAALTWKEKPPPPHETALDALASRFELVRLGREVLRRMSRGDGPGGHDPRQFDEAYWQVVVKESAHTGGHRVILQHRSLRTVLTPRYRLAGLDLRDPRIDEGLQISLGAIQQMNVRLKSAGTPFLVLLIPTKELVFKSVMPAEAMHAGHPYRELVENEEETWRRTQSALRNSGIAYLDALPVLRVLVENGVQPYPVSWDGHMNVIGHRAVADLVRTAIVAKLGVSLSQSR